MKKPKTPEQQRKADAQKVYFDRYMARKKAGLVTPGKKPFTDEEKKERKRASHLRYQQRKKAGLIGVSRVYDTTGTAATQERKLKRGDTDIKPTRKVAENQPKEEHKPKIVNRDDSKKVPVRLNNKTVVFASPGYDIEQLRAKFGISHEKFRI